ncbi:MAG: hypothetical protein ACTHJ7_04170 [Candidatus Nitrosocosmicus sp.]
MYKFKGNTNTSNGLKNKHTKGMFVFVIPIAVAAMLVFATSLASTNAVFGQANSTGQQQSSSSANTSDKSGTIKSVQTDAQGKWNLDGTWSLKGANSASPTFDANFSMAKLDGSAKHKHTISDFKIAGKPATDVSGATTYSGTATVSLKNGPANNVPITIIISKNGDFSLNVDPKATENHFGNTPIMGKVTA